MIFKFDIYFKSLKILIYFYLLHMIQWSMRFEEEEVRAVALGSSWVGAVTSLNFLCIGWFTGIVTTLLCFWDLLIYFQLKRWTQFVIYIFFVCLQRHVVYLDGPVVTAWGFGDELAVVTYSYTIIHLDKNRIFSITFCSADNIYKNGRRKFSMLETSVNDVEGGESGKWSGKGGVEVVERGGCDVLWESCWDYRG